MALGSGSVVGGFRSGDFYRRNEMKKKMKKNRSDIKFDAALRHEIEGLPETPLKELGEAMIARLDFHRSLLLKNHRKYYWGGAILSLAIPISSPAITWMMTDRGREIAETITMSPAIFGLLLTILTIINSVLRPAEEFISSAHMLVRLHDWEMSLAMGIREKKGDKAQLYHFFEIKDQELSKLGDALADSAFPQQSATPDGQEAHAHGDKSGG